MTSRVVPAIGEVIAASRRASRFNRLDFPAFGGPMIATCDAVAQPFAAMAVGEMALDLGRQVPRALRAIPRLDLGRQILVGKIDRRFEMGQKPQVSRSLQPR